MPVTTIYVGLRAM